MSENIFDKEVDLAINDGGYDSSGSTEEFTPEMQEQFRQIEALAQMDPSFANSSEYKDLMASVESSQAAGSNNSQEEDDEDEYEDDDSDEEEDDNDIFGINKEVPKAKEVRLNFDPPKEMIKFINSHYGVNDAGKFFSSVDTWRSQAQEGAEIKRDYEAISADLQAMPPEIKMAVQLWANGEDHMNAFEMSQRLDFSSDFGNQDVESLVQHYLEDEYNDLIYQYENEDIDGDEFEDKMILLAKTTKRIFSEDKKAIEGEREQFIQNQRNEFQVMKKTALVSVDNLSKAYPNFSKSEISKIRNILVEGKVDNLFMNANGSYNDDAAELVAYAMYGKKMLDSVKKVAERKGESSVNQRLVDSSPKNIKKQKAAASNQAVDYNAIGHLSGVFKGDPYA